MKRPNLLYVKYANGGLTRIRDRFSKRRRCFCLPNQKICFWQTTTLSKCG